MAVAKMLHVDHVILGVRDLDRAATRLREDIGLDSVPGGKHVRWGTANRIVPLGASYVELLGIVNAEEAERSTLGMRLGDQTREGDRLIGWCIAVSDIEGVAGRLDLPVVEGSRVRPDGTVLTWQSAGLETSMAEECLPFFITWTVPGALHPGRATAAHRVRPLGLAWVELSGDRERVAHWLGGEDAPIRWTDGQAGVRAVGISTEDGDIVLR